MNTDIILTQPDQLDCQAIFSRINLFRPVDDLGHFNRMPFSRQIYSDYLNYFKSRNKHFYQTHGTPITDNAPGPPHYIPPHSNKLEPIFFSDLSNRHFKIEKHLEEVNQKGFPIQDPSHVIRHHEVDGTRQPKIHISAHAYSHPPAKNTAAPAKAPTAYPTPYT